jgi:hypothetical protein
MRVFWDIALCSLAGVVRRFRGAYFSISIFRPDDGRSTHVRNVGLLQRDYYVPEDSRLHTRHRENLKPHTDLYILCIRSVLSNGNFDFESIFSDDNVKRNFSSEICRRPYAKYVDLLTRCSRRSQWPRGLRRRSAAAWLLRSRVRIPLGAWMFVSCVYMLCCPV